MGVMRISGGRVLITQGFCQADILVEEGKIAALEPSQGKPGGINADGLTVLPGFIDLHTHGGHGHDVNASNPADLADVAHFFASQGVTAWNASVLTDTQEQTLWCIQQIRQAMRNADGAALMGVHLEGPCLSQEYRGSMPEHLLLKKAEPSLFRQYQQAAEGHITYVTLSPEVEGAADLIPALRDMGIQVSIGHSGATYDQAMACIRAGAAAGTHVGNAMRLFHQHEPAIWGAVMESDAYCETICDGRHLHYGSVRLYLKIKGLRRVVAITDSIMAAGLPDGNYKLGVNDVVVEQGDAKLHDGTRAGSTLTMVQALKNFISHAGLTLEEASLVTSANAADMMGWNKGRIAPGRDADLVLLTPELAVQRTIVAGNTVYQAGG